MRTVTLEDSVLASLAMLPLNIEKFPFLRVAQPRPTSSCCGSSRPDLGPAKAAAAGLTGDKLAEFKKLLGADKVRIIYRAGDRTADVTI